MPVVVNKESGLAENLGSDKLGEALKSGTHQLPMYDPEGNQVNVDYADAPQLQQQGYTQPKPEELQALLKHAKFNSSEQQAKTFAEGALEGASFGTSTAAERALGVKPENINARREYNPGVHALGELSGVVGSSMTGVGEGAALTRLGELVAGKTASKLGPRLLQSAAKGIAEGTAMQAGNETSRLLSSDPNQSASTAIANVGMAALLGGAAGTAFGAVPASWEAMAGTKAGQFASDFKARLMQRLDNPEPFSQLGEELGQFYNSTKNVADEVYGPSGLKAQEIAKVMPEMSTRMTEQASGLANRLESEITSMSQKPQLFPERLTSKLQSDLDMLKNTISKPENSSQVFNALQDVKQQLQGYSKFDKFVKPVDEAYDFVRKTKELSSAFREGLEDSSVWGKAAERQQAVNKAFVKFLPALKDFEKRFTSEVAGERVLDPGKLQTYVSQLGKPNAEIKQDMLRNFMDSAGKYRQVLDETHANLGISSPFENTPLNAAQATLEKITPGAKVADDLLKHEAGSLVGAGLGSIAGSVTGHPFIGAVIGKQLLSPIMNRVMPAIARAVLSKPASGAGIKAAMEYGIQVAKGEAVLNKAAQYVFGDGSIPETKHIDKLKVALDDLAENPAKLTTIGEHLSHYAPEHTTAAAKIAANANNYLQGLKPHEDKLSPLDMPTKPSKTDEAKYERALEIAQNPAVLMKAVKEGSITVADLQHLNNLHPDLYPAMKQKLVNAMTEALSKKESIPYKSKIGISVFLGQPLDSSMHPQSIIANQPAPQAQQQQQPSPSPAKSQKLMKAPQMYETVQQSREMRHSSGK